MQRSSETVGALATAMAKAQAELVNPEKSLVATLRTESRGENDRSFRYAPLSSGLEIIRKTLGGHEIAIIQTTAVDRATGTINLTTMLAHASGEWIASDWPVCQLTDLATPRRMGAALTYARRYALFTLVGIAGEDDIDAPDLNARSQPSQGTPCPEGDRTLQQIDRETVIRDYSRKSGACLNAVLAADKSSILRDQLRNELSGLASVDDAKAWAKRILKDKNKLTTEDARLVEMAFEAKVTAILHAAQPNEQQGATSAETPKSRRNAQARIASIDKSTLQISEPRRYRNKAHLKFVGSQPCLICGRLPSDAHHLRFFQRRALGCKVSDEFTVPLCRAHHHEAHRSGDERAWWRAMKINPSTVSRRLWRLTRLNGNASSFDVKNSPPEIVS